MSALLERLAAVLDRVGMPTFADAVRFPPPDWHATDLTGWHAEHRDPAAGVWAVRPPCGYGRWTLYRPGSRPDERGFTRTVDVAAVHPASVEYGGDTDRLRLADVSWWMEVWIARIAGAPVLEMVEGWSEPYGPRGDQQEYVIYARTGGRP